MQVGVFIPIGNNGWLISTTSPQYKPSYDLNKAIVDKAEQFGFDFALSMIKLHGFGGPSEYWDYNLESFTLMAGLAAATRPIHLLPTCAVITAPNTSPSGKSGGRRAAPTSRASSSRWMMAVACRCRPRKSRSFAPHKA